jgi:rod shape-determining protein MreC
MIKNNLQKYFKYIAVLLLLVFLFSIGLLKPIESVLQKVFLPFMPIFQKTGMSFNEIFRSENSRKNLIAENDNLRNELSQIVSDEVRLKILEEENEILRDSLGFLKRNNYEYVMANIISRGENGDVLGQAESFVIDKGVDDGLSMGLAVVNSKGNVVGKIIEIKSDTALVALTFNSKCKLAAAIMGEENTSGLTEGELGLTVKMNFIPQEKNINEGDIVISSGLEENIPLGLIIGKVRAINKENNELWQEAEIESLIDYESLRIVSVIK